MGFRHVTQLGHITWFRGFDWLRDRGQLTRRSQLMDITRWRERMSHAGLGLREEAQYKGTLGASVLGTNHLIYTPRDWNLNTMRIHRQHPPPSNSQWAAPALSLSCTLSLPPYFLYHVLAPWRPCFSGSFGSISPSFRLRIAASVSIRTVGNTLSPMLQTAGTIVRSRRKYFNRPQSISPFSWPPLEAA